MKNKSSIWKGGREIESKNASYRAEKYKVFRKSFSNLSREWKNGPLGDMRYGRKNT